jgi:hypothetical protein
MSRDLFPTEPQPARDSEERESANRRAADSVEAIPTAALEIGGSRNEIQRPAPGSNHREPEAVDSPRAYYFRERTYFLRDSELTSLAEIGTFRVVDAEDFAQFSYAGGAERMNREIRRLVRQGLAAEKPFRDERSGTRRLLVLTKKGKSLVLKSGRLPEDQAIYHGLVKPREAKHDAALYRLYQRESARIAQTGGKTVRVVLDYELKRNLHRDLAQLGETGRTREARERFAEKHGLVLVGGKVQIPDLRLEYETAELARKHVDLELATRNYRPRALAQKAKAGFSIYAPREDASKLRRVVDEAELTARIFSL